MKRHLAVTAVAHVVPVAALVAMGHPLIAALVVIAGLGLFVPLTNAYLRGERRRWWQIALLDVPYFVHWTAGLLALPLVPIALALHGSLAGAYGVAFVLAAYGALVRRRFVQVRHVELALPGVRNYRIAHLSDLHIGPWTPRSWGLRWARRVSELNCDLVVVTGDLIQTGDAFLEDAADVVGALRARDGVFVALGNHDYYGDTERLVALLEARGVHVLRNRSHRTPHLLVAAVDDNSTHRDDLDAALSERRSKEPTVLLAHDPAGLAKAAERDVDVVLSGHTHGGQLAVPFLARRLNLGRFVREHSLGVYRAKRGTHLVVHPGLGTSGPPVRLGVAPAIVEITLRAP